MPCTLSQNDCSGAACVFCLPGLPSLCLPSLPLRSCGHGVPLPPGPSSLRMALRISLRDVVKPCTLSQNDCSGAACLCCLPGLPSLCLPSLSLSALAAWGRWPGLQSQGVRSPGRSCSSSHSSVGSQPGVCGEGSSSVTL